MLAKFCTKGFVNRLSFVPPVWKKSCRNRDILVKFAENQSTFYVQELPKRRPSIEIVCSRSILNFNLHDE